MENKQIANTILSQLGGNKFIAMTGAKNFFTNGNDICFNIGKNISKANRIQIILEADDTYTMKFIKFTNGRFTKNFEYIEAKVDLLQEEKGIYNDMLQDIFTQYTGMDTHL
jgi:hypothetical protein